MEKPYYVKRAGLFPVLLYDDTPILTFGAFAGGKARELCKLLNTAFAEGYIRTCLTHNLKIDAEYLKDLLA